MTRFILRRVLWAIPTLVIVTFLVYVALRVGTDPLESYKRINQRASPKKIQEYIEINGLYEGPGGYIRGYFTWLGQFVTGDWPRTIKGSREVWPNLKDALANSIRLGGIATIVGVTFGLSIGVFAALRPGSLRDTTVNTAAFFGLSIPPYVSAVLFQLVFAVYWSRWYGEALLPTSGVYPTGHRGFDPWLMGKHMILPVTVVAIQVIATYARYMRASLLEVLNSDYMRTAALEGHQRAQGARPTRPPQRADPGGDGCSHRHRGDPRRSDHHRGGVQLPGHGRVLPLGLHRRRLPGADAVDGDHRERRDPVQPVGGPVVRLPRSEDPP